MRWALFMTLAACGANLTPPGAEDAAPRLASVADSV